MHRLELHYRERKPLGPLDVTLKAPKGPLRLVATRLGLRSAERRYQVRRLLDHFIGLPAESLIVLAGDLNEWLL